MYVCCRSFFRKEMLQFISWRLVIFFSRHTRWRMLAVCFMNFWHGPAFLRDLAIRQYLAEAYSHDGFEIFAFGFYYSKKPEPTDLTDCDRHLMQALTELHACQCCTDGNEKTTHHSELRLRWARESVEEHRQLLKPRRKKASKTSSWKPYASCVSERKAWEKT